MVSDWISENAFGKEHVLVDLGTFPEAGVHGDELLAMAIGKRNFQLFGNRLLVRIPARKVAIACETHPIREGTTYFGCTHFWDGDGDGSEQSE